MATNNKKTGPKEDAKGIDYDEEIARREALRDKQLAEIKENDPEGYDLITDHWFDDGSGQQEYLDIMANKMPYDILEELRSPRHVAAVERMKQIFKE